MTQSPNLRAGLLDAKDLFGFVSRRALDDHVPPFATGEQLQQGLQRAVGRLWTYENPAIRVEWIAVKLKIWLSLWSRVIFAMLNIWYVYRMFLDILLDCSTSWFHYAALCTVSAEAAKLTWYILKAVLSSLKVWCDQSSEWANTVYVIIATDTLLRCGGFSLLRYLPIRRRAFGFQLMEEVLMQHAEDEYMGGSRKLAKRHRVQEALRSHCLKAVQDLGALACTFLSPVAVLVKLDGLPLNGNATCTAWFKLGGVINQIRKIDSLRSVETHAVLQFLATVNADSGDEYDPKVHFVRLICELVRSMTIKLGIIRAIGMWSYLKASSLGQIVRDGGAAVQRAFMKVDDIVKELEALKKCPVVSHHPEINQDVLQKVLECCWTYSLNGVEGHRAGHIIAVGSWERIQESGTIRGRNGWQSEPHGFINKDSSDIDLQDLIIEMNQDGGHIVDGTSGRICANKFFADRIAHTPTGGAGVGAAKQLSSISGTIVFKISSDGSLKEFRDGEQFKLHCGHRILGSPNKSLIEVQTP